MINEGIANFLVDLPQVQTPVGPFQALKMLRCRRDEKKSGWGSEPLQ